MPVNKEKYQDIIQSLGEKVKLVAVSKIKPPEDILDMYALGQRDFGENYVQELTGKQSQLPADIRWHFIGHLQSNKIKFIAPFIHLVHGVDSARLLKEIHKQALKCNRRIDCLLQVHIATEETKFGFDETELKEMVRLLENDPQQFSNVRVCGLMGMASFSDNMDLVRNEFKKLKNIFDQCSNLPVFDGHFTVLSMGMSADYAIAIEEGSNMVRIGSLLFGKRVRLQ